MPYAHIYQPYRLLNMHVVYLDISYRLSFVRLRSYIEDEKISPQLFASLTLYSVSAHHTHLLIYKHRIIRYAIFVTLSVDLKIIYFQWEARVIFLWCFRQFQTRKMWNHMAGWKGKIRHFCSLTHFVPHTFYFIYLFMKQRIYIYINNDTKCLNVAHIIFVYVKCYIPRIIWCEYINILVW